MRAFPNSLSKGSISPTLCSSALVCETGEWGTSYPPVVGHNSSTHYILETFPAEYFWAKFFRHYFGRALAVGPV